jgi:hypothetical protein
MRGNPSWRTAPKTGHRKHPVSVPPDARKGLKPMRFLPTKIHGLLDYLVGVALIAAPNLFRFAGVGGAAVWVPRVLGIGLIAYSFFTNYEWGVVKVLPMGYHLVVDAVAAAFLAASPFLFSFTHHGINAWLPHVVVGVTVLAVVAVSQTHPGVKAGRASTSSSSEEPEPRVRAARATRPEAAPAVRSGAWMPGATEADRRAQLPAIRTPFGESQA